MFRASGYLCHGEGESTKCGGGEMSCSKFVVWGILIITIILPLVCCFIMYNMVQRHLSMSPYNHGVCKGDVCSPVRARGMLRVFWRL